MFAPPRHSPGSAPASDVISAAKVRGFYGPWLRSPAVWAIPIACLVAITVLPILLASGVPAFQQDWAWPAVRSQCVPIAIAGFEPWYDTGIGTPAAYPASYLYQAIAGSSCVVFGPRLGLALLLFAALFFCAAGYGVLYRLVNERESLQPVPLVAFAVAAFAVANPVIVNKLQAGHIKFLLAYAILPWIATAALQVSRKRSAFILGALLGAAAMEPQFLLFGLFVAVVFCLYANTWRWSTLCGAVAIALLVSLPQLMPVFTPTALKSLDVESPVLFWQRSQSAQPADAFRLMGYIGAYALRLLPGWVKNAYWIVTLSAMFLPLLQRKARYLFLVGGALIAVAVVSAWNSPLAPLWTYAFSHFDWLAVFRELYNATAILVVLFAAAISITLGLLRQKARWLGAVLAIAIVALSVVCALKAASGIPRYTPTRNEASALQTIANAPGQWRFTAVPGTVPSANESSASGGYSPWSLSFQNHPVLLSTPPAGVELYTRALLRERSPHAQEWLLREDVGFVQFLHNWRTTAILQADPTMRRVERVYLHDFLVSKSGTIRYPQASLLSVLPFSAGPSGLTAQYHGAKDVSVLSGGTEVALQNFLSDISPATGWARTALTPILPSWAYAQPLGLYTLRRKGSLAMPGGLALAGDATGSIRSNECAAVTTIDAHFKVFRCKADPSFSGSPPLVISDARVNAAVAARVPTQGAHGSAYIRSRLPWHVSAYVDGRRGSAVVLRESFNPGWTASLADAKHVVVDGYANGWVLAKDTHGIVEFWYEPALLFFICLAISVGTLIFCATAIVTKAQGQ